MQPADTAKHAQRDESQAHNHCQRAADGSRDNPGNKDEQKIQPEESGHQAGRDKLGQTSLQIVNATNQLRLKSVLSCGRTQVIDDFEPVFVSTAFNHSKQENGFGAIPVDKALCHARIFRLLHHLHHLLVADQEGERRSIAFGQESRK